MEINSVVPSRTALRRLAGACLLGLCLGGAAAAAPGMVEAKVDFRILNYQENANYSPVLGQLTTLFQGELGETLKADAFEIVGDKEYIRLHLATDTADPAGLKTKLREIVTRLPAQELKDQLALVRMELSTSREVATDAAGAGGAAGPDRPGAEGAPAEPEGAAAAAAPPRAMRLEIDPDPAAPVDRPRFRQVAAQDVPLQKVVWMLASSHRVGFVVRPEAALRPVNLQLFDVDMDTLLKAMAESAKVDVIRREAYYVVGGGLQP